MRAAFTIVFNGDFTIEQCIRNALPVVDKYIVVEGATDRLKHLSRGGFSTDSTNDILDKLCAEFPEKLIVINGAWEHKLQMCNAAMQELRKHCDSCLLWQLDCDEFYHRRDMLSAMDFITENPHYTDVEFWGYHFFGGFEQHTPLRTTWGNDPAWRRLFRWEGQDWMSHAPPRLSRPYDVVLTRSEHKWRMYHYGYCWPRQVFEKFLFHQTFRTPMLRPFDYVRMEHPELQLVKFEGVHPVSFELDESERTR